MSAGAATLLRLAAGLPRQVRDARAVQPGPLVLSGPPSATRVLARALRAGGRPGLVRELHAGGEPGSLAGTSALVHVVRGPLTPTDEALLRATDRWRIPLVCLLLDPPGTQRRVLPYVPARAVVRASEVDEAAVDAVARMVAARADAAWALGAGLPALARPAARALVRTAAAESALAAATPRAGPDLPVLAAGQLDLAARLAVAAGAEPERIQAPALAGVVGIALTLRALVRRAGPGPGPGGRAVRAAVAAAGTAALGAALLALVERPGGRDRGRW
ncbi:MAG: hypothetical protein IT201_10450 [Thermoleophilia bacterium]|nr:hypothetical protein [Thermoleophilia bacterium]